MGVVGDHPYTRAVNTASAGGIPSPPPGDADGSHRPPVGGRIALRNSFRAQEVVKLRKAGVQVPERLRRATRNGAFRAAIFGVNDGLVSNLALIMGMVGANADQRVVLLAGFAGLLAGAFSMGAGEYVSMRAQREVSERTLSIETEEIAADPEGEQEELASIYRSRGFSPELADRMAAEAMSHPSLALETHARDELGIDPSTLGSPLAAAISSFLTFCLGAVVPLVPFLLFSGRAAVILSLAFSFVTLLGVGAFTAMLAGRPRWLGGLRMLLIGGGAATVTYGIGSLIGVTVA